MKPNCNRVATAIGSKVGAVLLLLAMAVMALGQQVVNVTPTTTLAAETANNTSTADSFQAQSNGNLGPGNVSTVPVGSLLNFGGTQMFAHFMPWFSLNQCGPGYSHMCVGYDSSDLNQLQKQINYLSTRGVNGVVVDWYGQGDAQLNNAALNLMTAATSNGNFRFALMMDGGALDRCNSTPSCDLTTELINDLTYAANTFEGSNAYLRINGQPVVFFFDAERYAYFGGFFFNVPQYTIDWAKVVSVPGNPLLIFQNAGGFTHAYSAGSFAWVILNPLNPDDWGQAYLSNFYSTGQLYPNESTLGTGYKGFNDSLAAWGSGRIMNQNCGQTWLNTFAQINQQYSSANPLQFLQLATLNDYEEGTELESGIDNCAFVTTSLTSTSLKWQLSAGDPTTVDHYEVFVGLNDANLMPLTTVAGGTSTSLDLSQYTFAPGLYSFYVKAVGKPLIRNQMSNAVHLVPGDEPPIASLSVSPNAGSAPLVVTASAVNSKDADNTIVAATIDFGDGTAPSVGLGPFTHQYNKPGTYRVLANIADSAGSSSAAAKMVNVIDKPPTPVLKLSATSGTAPMAITADATSSYDRDGMVASMVLDFGDKTPPVSASSPSLAKWLHTYSATGTYIATLKVTDNFGISSNTTTTVSVAGPAVSIVTPTEGATVSTPTHVSATATAPAGRSIATMALYVDGSSSPAAMSSRPSLSTDVNLTMRARHELTVIATDSAGATASSSVAVYTYSISCQNTTAETVLVCSPLGGSTIASPMHVVASATSSSPIASMQLYVDYGLYSTYNNVSSVDIYLPLAAGLHVIEVKAWGPPNGPLSSGAFPVTVSTASCSLSTVPQTVTICSPPSNSTVISPVHFNAGAVSDGTVYVFQVYQHDISTTTWSLVGSWNGSSFDQYVPISPGHYDFAVQAWYYIKKADGSCCDYIPFNSSVSNITVQ